MSAMPFPTPSPQRLCFDAVSHDTARSYAAGNGNEEAVSILLAAGADVKSLDAYVRATVCISLCLVSRGLPRVFWLIAVVHVSGPLLRCVADRVGRVAWPPGLSGRPTHHPFSMFYFLSRQQYGRTPLHWAAIRGHASVVALLLADPRTECDSLDSVSGDTDPAGGESRTRASSWRRTPSRSGRVRPRARRPGPASVSDGASLSLSASANRVICMYPTAGLPGRLLPWPRGGATRP